MRSPEMVKAFEQYRQMVSKYMDPGIAGRDYDSATAMIAKGQAVFMIMGDWQIGIFTAAGLKQGADYLCAQAPTDWGKPGFILNSDSVVFFTQIRSGLCRGAEAARASHHVAAVPDRVQPGQGLDSRASRRRSARTSTPASSSRRRICRPRSPTACWCARWPTT